MANRSVLLVVAFVAWTASAAGQEELRWRLNPDDQFHLETTTTRKQTIRFQGKETQVQQAYVVASTFHVLQRLADGSVEVEQKVVSAKPVGDAPAEAMPYVLKNLEGTTFRIHFNPTFQIVKLEGYDDFIKTLGVGNASYERAARSLMPEEMLRASLDEAFGFLKAGPVRAGDEWTRKSDVSLGPLGRVALTRRFRYEGPEAVEGRELHKITVATETEYGLPTGDPGVLPFRITHGEVKVTEGSGQIWFDARQGRLAKSSSMLKFKGALTVKLMDQDQVAEIVQDQSIQVRVLDRAPWADAARSP